MTAPAIVLFLVVIFFLWLVNGFILAGNDNRTMRKAVVVIAIVIALTWLASRSDLTALGFGPVG